MVISTNFLKLNRTPLLWIFSSVLFYISFAYDLVRTDYLKLLMLYSALFFLFYKLVQILKTQLIFLTWLAFLFRAIFILAIPNLSQDFYRFIWDGRMLLEGLNPYLHTVEAFISVSEFPVDQAQELHRGMGALNASHFTNYPPINQLCFVIASMFAGKSILGSVVVMRFLIISADFGTLFFGKKLLERLNIPVHNIFWYILNPFIIIELTGNLHFEGVMIFFLIWSLYLLHSGKWKIAAVILGCSISVKLIPLMFLPLFFKWFVKHENVSTAPNLTNDDEIISSTSPRNDVIRVSVFAGLTKLTGFYAITLLTTALFFLPFYSKQFISNYAKTVGLWFQDFEFNASLYYIAREIGYQFRGYNEIATIGKITPVLVVLFILSMAFFRKNKNTIQLITSMLLALSFYYFTATTVHPWYVATLLILSVFTNYKFPLVWSFAIILSYLAYMNTNNTENLWILTLEYTIVYSVFIWEAFINKKKAVKSLF
ncbi:mannosyltransferase PIG-M [Mariniflexile fucanivorans]|uniref:Mannosyltransferase PIG-M n=1 Tax=Mariniflexile fucanivorans TaxID=264023 RepID=A0A4R1RHE6_9FLAO|nr:mannosyltransferase [Mariniflexile fucanivorans]TCL65349.1 mannosyltransferase PIG-M [Mariniflexile fucanivorans]